MSDLERLHYRADKSVSWPYRLSAERSKHLDGKFHDFCPWCGSRLMASSATEWTGHPFCTNLECKDYDSIHSEQENRLRYVRERQRAEVKA